MFCQQVRVSSCHYPEELQETRRIVWKCINVYNILKTISIAESQSSDDSNGSSRASDKTSA